MLVFKVGHNTYYINFVVFNVFIIWKLLSGVVLCISEREREREKQLQHTV